MNSSSLYTTQEAYLSAVFFWTNTFQSHFIHTLSHNSFLYVLVSVGARLQHVNTGDIPSLLLWI